MADLLCAFAFDAGSCVGGNKGSFPDGCDGKYGFNRDSEADEGQYRDYPGLVESAFNAAVPFRSQLISFSSLTDLKLFCEKSINDKVVIGSDNWLFYSMESDIDDYKGTNLFTEGQLAQIASRSRHRSSGFPTGAVNLS